MNGFERFIYFLQFNMETPKMYGVFHIVFLCLTFFATIILSTICRNASNKKHKVIIFLVWFIYVVIELYKQATTSLIVEDHIAKWSYNWANFPFSFSTLPIYLMPFIFLFPDEKFNEGFESFLSTYSLFFGITLMIYPMNSFSSELSVNLAAMVESGFMIMLGVYILVRNRAKLRFGYFAKGSFIFILMLVAAFALNETMIFVTDETFNMLSISYHFSCELPYIKNVQANSPFIVFIFAYIGMFTAVAFSIYLIARIITVTTKTGNNK